MEVKTEHGRPGICRGTNRDQKMVETTTEMILAETTTTTTMAMANSSGRGGRNGPPSSSFQSNEYSFNNHMNGHCHDGSSRGNRPKIWGNAISENFKEFIEHWQDFFTNIYHNDEKCVLDVILLPMELQLTIILSCSRTHAHLTQMNTESNENHRRGKMTLYNARGVKSLLAAGQLSCWYVCERHILIEKIVRFV